MRRSALLGTLLLLGGCSGLGHFLGDTAEPPGSNPNAATGATETVRRVRGYAPPVEAIAPQPGNVWPGPPQPLPTLGDVTRGQNNGGGPLGGSLGGSMGGPLGGSLPRGGSMSMGEQDAIHRGVPQEPGGFAGGGIPAGGVSDPATRYRPPASGTAKGGGSSGDIVIPNGDGSSTVISPDGSVRTVKGTPR